MSNTKENKNKFHILITDNETGETLQEHDACVILGGFTISDEETQGVVCAHGSPLDVAKAYQATEKVLKEVVRRDPEVLLMSMLIDKVAKKEEEIIEKNLEEFTEEGEV